jgi:biotin-(acetyl-CoA carboxylase) ligase
VYLETSRHFSAEEAALEIGQRILWLYQRLECGDRGSLERSYRDRMWNIDREIGFLRNGKKESGTIRGVHPSGELLIEVEGRIHPFIHGEIRIDYPGS